MEERGMLRDLLVRPAFSCRRRGHLECGHRSEESALGFRLWVCVMAPGSPGKPTSIERVLIAGWGIGLPGPKKSAFAIAGCMCG